MNSIKPIIPRSIPRKHAICGFTTRYGGVSPPPFDSLNLGLDTPDDPLHVRENHSIFYRYAGVDDAHTATMKQVHGENVVIVRKGGIYPATDGLITSLCDVLLAVRVADCIPLLLFDPAHEVAGAIHCGWRSIAAGIAEKALSKMKKYKGTRPEDVMAVLGPSAGSCCYEIGKDTAEYFQPASLINRDEKIYGNLKAELSHHLLIAGLRSCNIEIISDCTICNESLYFSHRRNGLYSGRMLGYIMIKRKENL